MTDHLFFFQFFSDFFFFLRQCWNRWYVSALETIVLQNIFFSSAHPGCIHSPSGLGLHGRLLRTYKLLVLWRLLWGWVSLFESFYLYIWAHAAFPVSIRVGSITLLQSVQKQGCARAVNYILGGRYLKDPVSDANCYQLFSVWSWRNTHVLPFCWHLLHSGIISTEGN